MTLTFIEVCSGAGGLSSGLIKAGLTPLLLNDNNKDCCKTLEKNHPDVKIICDNMENINFDSFLPKNKVDLFCGGIPCQSFSTAGKRGGMSDTRGQLIYTFVDILDKLEPKMFLIENVKGLLNHNKGETIKEFINLLNRSDKYDINYKLLNAFDYGVPQKRERVFIVGTLKKYKMKFEFPEKIKSKKVLKDVLVDVPDSECAKYSDKKKELFKLIPQGGCWINLPEDLQKEYLGNSINSGGGKRGILHRLSMEKPSLTLLCSPSQKQTERCHPNENRPLSVREYARIQTFDDEYEFVGSISSKYKQIGNAVPIELARIIGESLIKYLKK